MITTTEIAGSRILVRPTMAETLVIAAIRGAMCDRDAKAFSLRTTPANARVLRDRVPALHVGEALSALETPSIHSAVPGARATNLTRGVARCARGSG
jgi:hypothetical protein